MSTPFEELKLRRKIEKAEQLLANLEDRITRLRRASSMESNKHRRNELLNAWVKATELALKTRKTLLALDQHRRV